MFSIPPGFLVGAGGPVIAGAFNPAETGATWALSNDNRTATHPNVGGSSWVTSKKHATSKRYVELVCTSVREANTFAGFLDASFDWTTSGGTHNTHNSVIREEGDVYDRGTYAGSTAAWGAGAVLMFAIDPISGSGWYGKNGTWLGDPGSGAYPLFTGMLTDIRFAISIVTSGFGCDVTANFTAATQSYSAPSGFLAWDD